MDSTVSRDREGAARPPARPAPVVPAQDDVPAGPAAPAPTRRGGLARRLILAGLVLAVLAFGAWQGRQWWTAGRFVESTDDAYVKADIATYAAQVPGTITEIAVGDNAAVKAGDVLLRIDDTRYRDAVAKAEAEVASATAAIATTDARIDLQASNVTAAEADLAAAKAQRTLANTNVARSRKLLARGAASQATTDQQVLVLDQAKEEVRKAAAHLVVARGQVPVLRTQRRQQEAALQQARAALRLARQDLDDTVIRASRDGVVGNRGVEVGEFVAAGTRLISLVPLDAVYVVANFKETQVRHFRPGMAADLTADMLDGEHVKGVIDSIAPASGSEFALLPTENATGNFTKIVQRIPVRIRIDPPKTDGGPVLRPGTSVVVDVDTRAALHEAK